jgi:hypothetical protein
MRQLIFYILLLTAAAGCKEKYELPYSGPSTGYLVVDGTINGGTGPTNIFISRTLALVDSVASRKESNAVVRVEGENGTQFPLIETQEGTYSSPQLNLQPNVKYRLRILTSDGKVYHSAYSENRKTPDIDNISWEKNGDGVQLFIDTHDPLNNTRYYHWDYEETWQFHSAFSSYLQYTFNPAGDVTGVTDRHPDDAAKMFTCWAGEKSATILIGSSARLSRDTIHLPINFIPMGSWKISVKYSILVHQYALSAAAYEFLQRMKKNTEQVGSLFDAQPSELIGNIQCEDDPSEVVIGFVEVTESKFKRIFINWTEVAPWNYMSGCYEESVFNHPDSINLGLIPTNVDEFGLGGGIVRFNASTPNCVDCTTRGTNVKPSFWP